jgi:hypothetical protein
MPINCIDIPYFALPKADGLLRRKLRTSAFLALNPVGRTLHTHLASAMRAAEKLTIAFHAVTDDLATAVIAFRCESVDGALEAVERALAIALLQRKCLVVVVSADIAFAHRFSPYRRGTQIV